MRSPREEELARLRELLAAAGGIVELNHWINLSVLDAPLKRRRGRPIGSNKFKEVDRELLFRAGYHFVASDGRLPPVQTIIRETVNQIFEDMNPPDRLNKFGASKEAVVRRLMDRLKSGTYITHPDDPDIPPLAIVAHGRNELAEISGAPLKQIKRKNSR